MSIVKGTLLVAALVFSAAAPALASDGGREDGQAWLLNPGPVQSGQTLRIVTPRVTGNVALPRGTSYRMARDMNMSGT